MQAVKHCQAVLSSRAGSEAKAVAYCWLFHLVGDLHQPLHSTALFSVERFPKEDRGGNDIPLRRGRNLHALWDGLLGRQHFIRDVDREVAELSDRQRYGDVWRTAERETSVPKWVQESHELCKGVVYSDAILDAVRKTARDREIAAITLPETYLREAGDVARGRIIAAGTRLGNLLEVDNGNSMRPELRMKSRGIERRYFSSQNRSPLAGGNCKIPQRVSAH